MNAVSLYLERGTETFHALHVEAAAIEAATPRILRAMGECLGWDVGALWRVDREAEALAWDYRAGCGPALSPNTFPMSFLMKTFRADPSPNAKDYTRPSAFPSCSGRKSWILSALAG